MTNKIEENGNVPDPLEKVPDRMGESHDSYMNRIRKIRSRTDPEAAKRYGIIPDGWKSRIGK